MTWFANNETNSRRIATRKCSFDPKVLCTWEMKFSADEINDRIVSGCWMQEAFQAAAYNLYVSQKIPQRMKEIKFQ